MKRLLFDQNLSPHLVERLVDLYPGSTHVSTLELGTASDGEIWEYARQQDDVIVTKDVDFSEQGLLLGFPPKVIWIWRGQLFYARHRNSASGKPRRYYELE